MVPPHFSSCYDPWGSNFIGVSITIILLKTTTRFLIIYCTQNYIEIEYVTTKYGIAEKQFFRDYVQKILCYDKIWNSWKTIFSWLCTKNIMKRQNMEYLKNNFFVTTYKKYYEKHLLMVMASLNRINLTRCRILLL